MKLFNCAELTLAVLAGGRGARMGGPKSGLAIAGQPILAYLHERLVWPGPTVLVTSPGNEHPAGAEVFGREVTDPVAGLGPLRGILTALESAETEYVIAVTVDMPAIEFGHLRWLISELGEDQAVMCSRAKGGVDRIESFPLVLRRALAPAIAASIAAGKRSVHGLAEEEAGVRIVRAPASWNPKVWTNLNHPEDLKAFERDQ
jgi:molybdopterin-guanine dinucleotide biosynthesis protein A